jgi:ankyrin repeat protein
MERMHSAAFFGDLDGVNRYALEEDPGCLDARLSPRINRFWRIDRYFSWTPLMLAARRGHEVVVARLLELGADVAARVLRG